MLSSSRLFTSYQSLCSANTRNTNKEPLGPRCRRSSNHKSSPSCNSFNTNCASGVGGCMRSRDLRSLAELFMRSMRSWRVHRAVAHLVELSFGGNRAARSMACDLTLRLRSEKTHKRDAMRIQHETCMGRYLWLLVGFILVIPMY